MATNDASKTTTLSSTSSFISSLYDFLRFFEGASIGDFSVNKPVHYLEKTLLHDYSMRLLIYHFVEID